jgi:5-formyltetrahydrofolate cyclo-ligase
MAGLRNKRKLRSFMLEKRKNMEIKEVEEKSEIVVNQFLNLYSGYKNYLLYFSFSNEVNTYKLICCLKNVNKRVFAPKIKGDELLPAEVTGMQNLSKNRYNILEPVEFAECYEFDIVVVPGVAFDKNCNRVGFGAGFYDKLLPKLTYQALVGFAYDYQVVEGIEKDDFDIPMDVVITEKNIYRRNEC